MFNVTFYKTEKGLCIQLYQELEPVWIIWENDKW